MSRIRHFSLYTILLLLNIGLSYGQMPLSENAKISILTCEKGNELYSLFGHTAIRIQDTENDLNVVFNYGTFDFNTENFYLKFLKGDLQYFVTANSFNEFLYQYTLENRSVYEQHLNLTEIQKQQLFDALSKSLESDERYYTYKFIDRNCTNMVVDKVNATLGENCIVKTTEKGKTYREILYPYLENHFFENLGINIIFGKKVDEDGKRLFLPNQFMESLKEAKFNGKPVSEQPKTLLNVTSETESYSLWNNFYFFSLLLVLIVISRKEWLYFSFLGISGILGIFLSLVGFYSFHEEVTLNYNVLLFNPLLLLLMFFNLKKKAVWVQKITKINLVLLAIFIILLLNKPNFMMFLPIIFCSVYLQLYFLRKSKTQLLASVK